MMMSAPQRPLSPRERLAWRRAADELLIVSIFGNPLKPLRDGDVGPARPRRALPCPVALPKDQHPASV